MPQRLTINMVLDVAKKQEFLMSGDVARILGLSHVSIARLVQAGLLPTAGETPTGYRLYRRADVERLRKERKTNPPRRGRPRKPKEKRSTQ